MQEYYIYNITLPYSNICFRFRELKSKEQLILSKTHTLLPTDKLNNLSYASLLYDVISNCTENKKDLKKINFIDYILYVLKIRAYSCGESITLEIKEGTEEDEEYEEELERSKPIRKSKIIVSLNSFTQKLYEQSQNIIKENIIETSGYKIFLSWPLIDSEQLFLEIVKNNSGLDAIIDTSGFYIDKIICDQTKTINFANLSPSERIKIFNKLPQFLQSKIYDKIYAINAEMGKIKLFGEQKNWDSSINFYNGSYQNYLRIFLSENLRILHRKYFILASKRIDMNYIDNLSVGEREIYYNFILEDHKKNEEQMEENNSQPFRSSIDLGLDEYN